MSYRDKLIRYVMCHNRCDVAQAEKWLNQWCPQWVESDPPTATPVTVDIEEIDDEAEDSNCIRVTGIV